MTLYMNHQVQIILTFNYYINGSALKSALLDVKQSQKIPLYLSPERRAKFTDAHSEYYDTRYTVLI